MCLPVSGLAYPRGNDELFIIKQGSCRNILKQVLRDPCPIFLALTFIFRIIYTAPNRAQHHPVNRNEYPLFHLFAGNAGIT